MEKPRRGMEPGQVALWAGMGGKEGEGGVRVPQGSR